MPSIPAWAARTQEGLPELADHTKAIAVCFIGYHFGQAGRKTSIHLDELDAARVISCDDVTVVVVRSPALSIEGRWAVDPCVRAPLGSPTR